MKIIKAILPLLPVLILMLIVSGCSNDSSVTAPQEETSFSKFGGRDSSKFGDRDSSKLYCQDSIIYTLSDEEKASLTKMRIEEKLARDVYRYFSFKYGVRVFANIAKSEEQHMKSIQQLLVKYLLEDPLVSDVSGEFPTEAATELYKQLTEQGSVSVTEAYKVGVIVEELDIKDLEEDLLIVDNTDIIRVYEHIKSGSVKHLAAFNKLLAGVQTGRALSQ